MAASPPEGASDGEPCALTLVPMPTPPPAPTADEEEEEEEPGGAPGPPTTPDDAGPWTGHWDDDLDEAVVVVPDPSSVIEDEREMGCRYATSPDDVDAATSVEEEEEEEDDDVDEAADVDAEEAEEEAGGEGAAEAGIGPQVHIIRCAGAPSSPEDTSEAEIEDGPLSPGVG